MAKKDTHTAQPSTQALPSELVYGDTRLAIADIPAVSQVALMARGLSHILGNEVASRVAAYKKKYQADNAEAFADDPEAMEDSMKANAEALSIQYYDEALAKIMGGTLGIRAVGPRGSSIDTLVRGIAIEELKVAIGKTGQKWPAKADGMVKTKSGDMSRADLIEAYVAKHGERLKVEAERRANATREADAEALDL